MHARSPMLNPLCSACMHFFALRAEVEEKEIAEGAYAFLYASTENTPAFRYAVQSSD